MSVAQPEKEAAEYKFPDVNIGDIVCWYPDGDTGQPHHLAIVGRVYMITVEIVLLDPNQFGKRRSSVRHVSDPRLASDTEIRKNGGWDFRLADKRAAEMADADVLSRLNRLEAVVERLYGAPLATPPRLAARPRPKPEQ